MNDTEEIQKTQEELFMQKEQAVQARSNNTKAIAAALAYLISLLTFPFAYQFVVEKVMVGYDFRWAAIAAVWLVLVGGSLSLSNYFVAPCSPKIRFFLRAAVFLIILADMLISWFGYRWFSMISFVCAAVSLSDWLLCMGRGARR